MTSAPTEVCVIGRCNFAVGIGALTYAFCEALARHVPVSITPTEPHLRDAPAIRLPSGRWIPVRREGQVKATFFVDVIWNGQYDRNHELVPEEGVRFAYYVGDSSMLAREAVRILNQRFDVVLVPCPHLVADLKANGVKTPVAVFPAPLPLEPLLARPYRPAGRRLRIGCMAAFHPRKCLSRLVEGYATAFDEASQVELLLHSNLAFGVERARIERQIEALGIGDRAAVSADNLSEEDKAELLDSFDVFANVSRGEAYSIGAREALALGKPLVLSAVGGHVPLRAAPGVFLVPTALSVPARYPEIDNRVLGEQREVLGKDVAKALAQAVDYVRCGPALADTLERRKIAAGFSFSRLSAALAALIEPGFSHRGLKPEAAPHLDLAAAHLPAQAGLARSGGLTHRCGVVVQAHDGGFFSVFNTYLSHLVWGLKDGRCAYVLPDWDTGRLLERTGGSLSSFCYGRVEDGNVWLKLFEPVFGFDDAALNNPAVLYGRTELPAMVWNEHREPLLTHVNAAELYQQPWFPQWRAEYHAVYRRHVRLRPRLRQQIELFAAQNFRNRMIAAHVRHPSHAMEQPTARMPTTEFYIRQVHDLAASLGLSMASDSDWGVFLATDQDSAVDAFVREFGRRVVFAPNAERTPIVADRRFRSLSREEQLKEGHQVQHLAAADPQKWSSRLAEQVIFDAALMARCDFLLHAVSNISTAVSYMNPRVNLVHCGLGA
jgi:glycosyltransferase involved in cell wall biosynthesis